MNWWSDLPSGTQCAVEGTPAPAQQAEPLQQQAGDLPANTPSTTTSAPSNTPTSPATATGIMRDWGR